MRHRRTLGAYRRLLVILPPHFRWRWGEEMEEVLRHRLDEAGASALRRTGVRLRAGVDLVVLALTERWRGEGDRDDTGRGTMGFHEAAQDLKYAVRSVRRAPGFALVAVVTLALGIAASSATFSVVHAVLLRVLPYGDADRLVVVWPEVNANKAMAIQAERDMPSLEAVSGLSHWTLTMTGVGEPREITGTLVSPRHFDVLGVEPLLGRTFLPEEGLPGAGGVAVLSYDFWVRAFGADADIVGRVVDIAGADHDRRRVVGVMPQGVRTVDGAPSSLWIPLEGDPALNVEDDETWYVNTRVARLAPGTTLAQANQEVLAHAAAVQGRLPRIFDEEDARTATVQPLRVFQAEDLGTVLWVVLGAVTLVLLIACANVANLLLARGEARARDLSVRAALGAGRGRVARMLLAEAALLGVGGGGLGIGAAYLLVDLIVTQAPRQFPGLDYVSMNGAVLIFAVLSALVATLLSGVVPALRASRSQATASLGGAARGVGTHTGSRLSTMLVGAQVGLAVVVVVGSGLMLRSLTKLMDEDPGLDGRGVIAFRPNPPGGRYPDGEAFRDYYAQVMERVAATPGIQSVGAINLLPGRGSNWSFPTYPEGVDLPEGSPTPSINFRAVRAGYFETLGIPLLAGRTVAESDGPDAEEVVVVNRAFAERFWPGEDPLGRNVRIFSPEGAPSRVIGVVGDVRQHGRASAPAAEMYYSHGQVPWNQMSMWVMARVSVAEPLAMAATIQEAVWSVDRDVPIAEMVHMESVMGESTRTTRFLALLLSAFGLLALVLGGIGVFGVTAYTVGRRTPEFGVRIALGSSRAGVLRSAARVSLGPVAVGVVVGLAAAASLSKLLGSVLYGVEPTDPLTFGSVALLLAVVATAATLVPAWRASRVDPVRVLGSD